MPAMDGGGAYKPLWAAALRLISDQNQVRKFSELHLSGGVPGKSVSGAL